MTTARFRVKDFDRLQHYRDRTPPWIKFYNSWLEDYAFARLPDATKAHLLLILLLASRTGNDMPFDPEWVGKRINATEPVDLVALVRAEFLIVDQALPEPEQVASAVLADRKHVADTEERERRGEESRGEGALNALDDADRFEGMVGVERTFAEQLEACGEDKPARMAIIRKLNAWEEAGRPDAWPMEGSA